MRLFLTLSLFLFVYLFFRLILRLPVRLSVKILAGGVLFLLCQHQWLFRQWFGVASAMDLPAWMQLCSGWAFAFLILLFCLTLCADLLLLGRRLFSRQAAGGLFSPGRRQALLAVLALAPATYGVRQGIAGPGTRRLDAPLPRLPQALEGLTLLHISDLHISNLLRKEWVQGVVESADALQPDLILLTGDLVDGRPSVRRADMAPLGELRARHGVFACAGNHEYYSGFSAWMNELPALGITMLLNRHVALSIRGETLVLAGVTDIAAESYGLPPPDTAAALAGAPQDALRILLKHRPTEMEESLRAEVDLQLSGHTHGGQIIGLKQLVARFNQGYLYGWHRIDRLRMYISSGAGLWGGFPVRLGVPSEIALLTLRRE